MKTTFRLIAFILALSFLTHLQAEVIDSTEEPTEAEKKAMSSKSRLTKMGDSHVELKGSYFSGSGEMYSISWVVNPHVIIGIQRQRLSNLRTTSGGDLDAGQWYSSQSGYSGQAAFVGGKYFFNPAGIQVRGWFASLQVGRIWGKYEFSQDRYERENGFLGQIFGVDKKLAESSQVSKPQDGDIARASMGYIFPWLAQRYLDGLSIQVQLGLESNSLPNSQSLSTKFSTRQVGDDIKFPVFAELGIAAYF